MVAEEGEAGVSQLVVVGASAGGIEALSTLVATIPTEFPVPIVVAQHLDPSRTSRLEEILARRSTLPIRTVHDREPLQPGLIYVVPGDRHVELSDHAVSVRRDRLTGADRPKPSIDLLFQSAAEAFGEHLIAVILTGSGSDGAAGAREVHRAGGTVIIQNPETATYPSMPLSLAPSTVDLVAELADIGPLLLELVRGTVVPSPADEDRPLRSLLEQLRDHGGIDFTPYKLPTIMRRLQRRMVATGSNKLIAYVRYLQTHPEEYQRLISSFLIKVTEFFRDPELVAYLRNELLPELIAQGMKRGHELRFWSAGCATGEEAYSLAILVAEILGHDLDRFNVRIFATDLDNDAITFARRGIYPRTALTHLSPDLIDRYFIELEGEYEVKKHVRGLVIFGQHDLGQRAPFPRTDLVLCRNVLIYFTPELQKRALQLFAFSLREGGYLVLGQSETTNPLAEYFAPVHPRLRVYRRQGDRVLIPPGRIKDSAPRPPAPTAPARRSLSAYDLMHAQREARHPASGAERSERLLLRLPVGVVLIDRRYDIQTINTAARRLLGIHGQAIGEDFIHLTQIVPPVALRTVIDAAFRGEAPARLAEIPLDELALGETRYLQIDCYPDRMEVESGSVERVLILVSDVTEAARLRRESEEARAAQQREIERLAEIVRRLSESNRQLTQANEELANANAELQSANEEYLVANEEVQAATEEVETLNEELQATNEELETLNEELQATIEELNTTNDDLEARTFELQDLATSLEAQRQASEAERARLAAILVSLGDAVLVVDQDGQTVLTNDTYEQMFGSPDVDLVPQDGNGQPLATEATPRQRAARGESFRIEFTVTAPDGTRRWYEANGQAIRAHGGTIQGGVVTIRDITERSLRRLQDEFLALASHELRTPLTVVSGYLDMLVRALPPEADPRLRNYAAMARAETRRLGELTRDLLDVARLQSGKLRFTFAPVDLGSLVARVVEMAHTFTQGQTIRLEASAETEPLLVTGDAGRLEQVLLNLLTNAISHAPGTDRIDVRLRRVDGAAEMEVQDYGVGIPAADLPDIFSRFYQASQVQTGRRSRGGLGLGLYITKEIVDAHDGTIEVRSQEGQGTTFTIRLPLAE